MTKNNNPLGFQWDPSIIPDVPQVGTHPALMIYKQQLAGFVWDAAQLEGNPYTYVEVKTLLDGVTVGGRKVSDTEHVLNLAHSSKKLIELVASKKFQLDKDTFTTLNGIIARNEALEWGVLRGEGHQLNYTPYVVLGEHGEYHPLPTQPCAPELNRILREGAALLNTLSPFAGGLLMFLFGTLQMFFFDGNKRTNRHMMNGWLMLHGYQAISIPAARAQEFNAAMVRFYLSKDATEMLKFLVSCYRR